jgi:putative ABC transport system ATP-binding protein
VLIQLLRSAQEADPVGMSLKLENLTVRYADGESEISALDNVSLSANAGEVTVVTGPSGSGKSTLLAVAGLLRSPDAGAVTINGRSALALKASEQVELRRKELAFIFQSANLFSALTALEQLEFVAHARGQLDAAARARAASLLEMVGLGNRGHHRPAALSGGERQRVGIARALMTEPSVMLVDEPTASLDQNRGEEILDLIVSTTRTNGIATLLVTHELRHLEHADQRLHMVDGALVAVPGI